MVKPYIIKIISRRISKKKRLQQRQFELQRELEQVDTEIRNVTKKLKRQLKYFQGRLERETNKIASKIQNENSADSTVQSNQDEKTVQDVAVPLQNTSLVPVQTSQTSSEIITNECSAALSLQSQNPVPIQINSSEPQNVYKLGVANKNQNIPEIIIKIQSDSNDKIVVSQPNLKQNNKQNNSAINKNKNNFKKLFKQGNCKNTNQKSKDIVVKIKGEAVNLVSTSNSNTTSIAPAHGKQVEKETKKVNTQEILIKVQMDGFIKDDDDDSNKVEINNGSMNTMPSEPAQSFGTDKEVNKASGDQNIQTDANQPVDLAPIMEIINMISDSENDPEFQFNCNTTCNPPSQVYNQKEKENASVGFPTQQNFTGKTRGNPKNTSEPSSKECCNKRGQYNMHGPPDSNRGRDACGQRGHDNPCNCDPGPYNIIPNTDMEFLKANTSPDTDNSDSKNKENVIEKQDTTISKANSINNDIISSHTQPVLNKTVDPVVKNATNTCQIIEQNNKKKSMKTPGKSSTDCQQDINTKKYEQKIEEQKKIIDQKLNSNDKSNANVKSGNKKGHNKNSPIVSIKYKTKNNNNSEKVLGCFPPYCVPFRRNPNMLYRWPMYRAQVNFQRCMAFSRSTYSHHYRPPVPGYYNYISITNKTAKNTCQIQSKPVQEKVIEKHTIIDAHSGQSSDIIDLSKIKDKINETHENIEFQPIVKNESSSTKKEKNLTVNIEKSSIKCETETKAQKRNENDTPLFATNPTNIDIGHEIRKEPEEISKEPNTPGNHEVTKENISSSTTKICADTAPTTHTKTVNNIQSSPNKLLLNLTDIESVVKTVDHNLLQKAKEILAQNETVNKKQNTEKMTLPVDSDIGNKDVAKAGISGTKQNYGIISEKNADNSKKEQVMSLSNNSEQNEKGENYSESINTNIIDNNFLNKIYANASSMLNQIRLNSKKFKNKSKIYCFENAVIVGCIPTDSIQLTNTNNDQNVTDSNIIDMEIDDDNQNSSDDSMESSENIENSTVTESESNSGDTHDIESDIVEIIDLIKSNPTDFENLLHVITHNGDTKTPDTEDMLLNDIATAIGDILKNSSSHSLRATMSKEKVTCKMTRRERRKRYMKTQQSIHKLFHQLRETSQNESQNNRQNSLMDSQESSQTSIIDLDDSNVTMIPNELRINMDNNSVLILDGEQKACSTPKRVSLQKAPRNTVVDGSADVILAQSNNNNNKSLNETKVINSSSFQTIDLTTDSGFNKTERSQPTVIDISDTGDDVTLVSATSSMSGDSEVTILRQPVSRKLRKFTNGIANLKPEEKGKLLELITQTIFNGCEVPSGKTSGVPNLEKSVPRAPPTAEDTYIKEVILGTKASRSSIGSNIYHPDRQRGEKTGPRMIVIDGSNVAMEHGRGKFFSVRGLKICIDYFLRRGHVVKAFVPRFRCRMGKSSDPRLLDLLERKGLVIYTPSREVQGRTITPYDDRYIIQCAAEFDAVVVSGDNFRDLASENPRWRSVIDHRILPFTWVDDMLMFPRDPLGRNGPTLEQFLNHPGGSGRNQDFIRIN